MRWERGGEKSEKVGRRKAAKRWEKRGKKRGKVRKSVKKEERGWKGRGR